MPRCRPSTTRPPSRAAGSKGARPRSSVADVLLVSCYELGHQPFSLTSPLASLRQAGFEAHAVDTSVEELPDGAVRAAKLLAISVPMHTAMRLAEGVAQRVRAINPSAHLNMYGLYAW